jgi:hypothetical protein
MEIIQKIMEKFGNTFLKEKSYFLNRREINWIALRNCFLSALGIAVVVILFLPSSKPMDQKFQEGGQAEPQSFDSQATSGDPTLETIRQLSGGGQARVVPSSLDHLYASPTLSGGGGSAANNRNVSMILARDGLDSKTQLPPGSRLPVRLYEKAIVANQGMPVIGILTRDYVHEDSIAIPQGSKVFGIITFDDNGDRAKVDWQSIQLPDGRERQISAIGVGTDGQLGVPGKTQSDALKNTVGQTLTRFIGAYAEGSMQRGSFGSNQGGGDNGWKNAIAETARDRADAWAESMKKEKRWIEVSNQTEFFAVLTANFAFRDPGATYGR